MKLFWCPVIWIPSEPGSQRIPKLNIWEWIISWCGVCMLFCVCTQVTAPIHIRPHQTAASQVCDTLPSKAAHKREKCPRKGSICYGRVAFLKQASIYKQHYKAHTHTQVHCCEWSQVWKKRNLKLYSGNIYKNRVVHKEINTYFTVHSMAKYIQYAAQNMELFRRRILPIHQLYDRTSSSKIFVQLQRFVFSWLSLFFFFFFYSILHSVYLCQSVRQGRVDFKQSCPIKQHITALPALPLKHPGWSMLSGTQSIRR